MYIYKLVRVIHGANIISSEWNVLSITLNYLLMLIAISVILTVFNFCAVTQSLIVVETISGYYFKFFLLIIVIKLIKPIKSFTAQMSDLSFIILYRGKNVQYSEKYCFAIFWVQKIKMYGVIYDFKLKLTLHW